MSAQDYLRRLREEFEVYDWMLNLLPEGAHGTPSDPILKKMWEDLGVQTWEEFWELFRDYDWATSHFQSILPRMPLVVRSGLAHIDDFAVGSRSNTEINGAAIRCPDSKGVVVLLDGGLSTIVNYVAQIIASQLPSATRHRISEAWDLHSNMNSLWRRSLRILTGTCRILLHRVSPDGAALDLWGVLSRYSALGVSDPPKNLKLKLKGVPPSNRSLGHHLECVNGLGHLVVEFCLLHEIAHVLNGDLRENEKSALTKEQEFLADAQAVRFQILTAPKNSCSLGAILSAYELLFCILGALEDYARGPSASHPPAKDRIEACHRIAAELASEEKLNYASAKNLSIQIRRTFIELWEQKQWLRHAEKSTGETAFDRLLERAIEEEDPDVFRDQVPRWLFLGASNQLCSSIARTRCRLESQTPSEDVLAKLELVNWVWTGASNAVNIRTMLNRRYEECTVTKREKK